MSNSPPPGSEALPEQTLDHARSTGQLKPAPDIVQNFFAYEMLGRLTNKLTRIKPNMGMSVFRCSGNNPVGIHRQQKPEGLDGAEKMDRLTIAGRLVHRYSWAWR